MPDKKLTENLSNNSPNLSNSLSDNEIKKALECCIIRENCHGCPLWNERITECLKIAITNALDLIIRLQAENERLTAVKGHINTLIHRDCEYPTTESYNEAFQKALARLYDNIKAKAEAYKEFAERLKTEYAKGMNWFKKKESYYVDVGDIDNLLKELERDA